jgi:hypothetical protein
VYSSVPWQMRMLRFMVGDSVLWNAIGQYSRDFRVGCPDPGEFERILQEKSGLDYQWFFNEWNMPGAKLDYHFLQVVYRKDASGVDVSGYVKNDGSAFMPAELAFVGEKGDTLIHTLTRKDFDRATREAKFSLRVPRGLHMLIIDPHCYLNDSRRDNNVQSVAYTRANRPEPAPPIPKFRGDMKHD